MARYFEFQFGQLVTPHIGRRGLVQRAKLKLRERQTLRDILYKDWVLTNRQGLYDMIGKKT